MAKNPKHYTLASVMDLCSRKRIHSAIDSMAFQQKEDEELKKQHSLSTFLFKVLM